MGKQGMVTKVGKSAALAIALGVLLPCAPADAAGGSSDTPLQIRPEAMAPIAKVDERFQSFDLEMAEVVGGRFWAPYPKPGEPTPTPEKAPRGSGFISAAFRKREPVDLADRRLRMLAKALGPAYMRVSGTWANSVYFQDTDGPAPASPPAGYDGVLTREQWAGVVDFAKSVDAKILTSFATSKGARDASGAWSPDQTRRLVKYTRAIGGEIYAAELTNEPNAVGYPPEAFAHDVAIFHQFLKSDAPEIKSVGPGTTGEAGFNAGVKAPRERTTDALLSTEPRPTFDIFDYHFYGAVSERCAGIGKTAMTSPDQALSEDWLGRTDKAYAFYAALRDRYMPGAPIWVTETAQAACGGDRWSATFVDSFRYVDQLGRLARHNVAAVFHNTLAASDYALIDETTRQPRPNYWAALLWRRLMGETVLDAGTARQGLHVYAHCLRGQPGGVALVAINLDQTRPQAIELPSAARRYTLSADQLQSKTVRLNGKLLVLTADDHLPPLVGANTSRGRVTLAPATISFFALPSAANPACR